MARPLVVAHRGASSTVAEHTLGAYTSAIESGADALECDVRLTRDGHLVCVHDRTVDRTSDGRGVVSELDLARLQALDFASWHDKWPDAADDLLHDEPYLAGVAPDRIDAKGQVLRLETLLELVRDADRSVRMLIETKHPTRYGGLVEKELVRVLARFGWAGEPGPDRRRQPDEAARVIVMSFAPTALRRIRLLAPELPTVLLMDRLLPGRREAILPGRRRHRRAGNPPHPGRPRVRRPGPRPGQAGLRLDRRRPGRPRPGPFPGRRRGHHQPPGRNHRGHRFPCLTLRFE